MDSAWWMLFGFAGTAIVVAVIFLTLWLKANAKLSYLKFRISELQRTDAALEEFRQHTMLAAKTAALEAGQQLSSKLLDDHKRENEAARELHSKATQTITQSLSEHVTKMGERLATVHDAQNKQREALATVWQTLSAPISAGKIAEIGLENLLKSFGLVLGKDFDTQHTITQLGKSQLKPDVVIWLPNDRVMVIDAKASKHLMEIAKATDEQDEQIAKEQLKVTMNKHLKDLTSKDYRAALLQMHKEQGKAGQVGTVWSVMYVPSEMTIEHIHQVDPEFADKLYKSDIILASRGTLHGLLSLARLSVENERQMENSAHIVEGARALLDGVTSAFGHVESLGKSLKSSLDHFNKFAGSANQSILSRARKLQPYGVTPNAGKELPEPISKYNVAINTQESDVIALELIEKN